MSSRKITEDDLTNPSGILFNIINDYIERKFDSEAPLKRAVVVSVDLVGGQLTKTGEPLNPKNTIRAKMIPSATNLLDDEELPTYWPAFSHDIMPIKPGEHVYIIHDSLDGRSGVWFSRAPQPLTVGDVSIDNRNFVDGTAQYLADENNDFSNITAQQYVQKTEGDPGTPELPEDFVRQEPPPPMYNARVGDRVIEGSHNSTIVLGRDRVGDTTTGIREESGDVRIVAGRTTEDVNIDTDSSTILVTQNTDIDVNLGLDEVGERKEPSASIAIRSDEIRINARNGMKIVVNEGELHISAERDMKIIVDDGDLRIDAANITIGDKDDVENPVEPVVLGDALKDFLALVKDFLLQHDHPTGVGPSGPASAGIFATNSFANPLPDSNLANFKKVLYSKTVKSKP